MTQQAAAPEANWWGAKPAWAVSVNSPNAGAHQVLVDACGAAGALAADGLPLSAADLFRRARIRTHPDRHAGDRRAWDQVEAAGRALGLLPHP